MALVFTHNFLSFLNKTFLLIFLFSYFTTYITFPSSLSPNPFTHILNTTTTITPTTRTTTTTTTTVDHLDHSKCLYLKKYNPCNYLHVFYCIFGGFPSLGYSLGLLVLLSLLGVKSLSRELKLYFLLVSVVHFYPNSLQGNEEEDPSSYYMKFKAKAAHYIRWFIDLTEMPQYLLGLTVLAWGNSLGDLIANMAMAVSNGPTVDQAAVSGYYGGPIFNTLAGLGLSLVVSAWSAHPRPFLIPVGPAMFEILGFMIGGLVWTLVILPKRDMKLDSVLGVGLLAIYSCFLSLRLSQSLGLVQFSKQSLFLTHFVGLLEGFY